MPSKLKCDKKVVKHMQKSVNTKIMPLREMSGGREGWHTLFSLLDRDLEVKSTECIWTLIIFTIYKNNDVAGVWSIILPCILRR